MAAARQLHQFDVSLDRSALDPVENKTITRKLMEDIEFNLSPLIAAASTIFVVATVLLMWAGNLAKGARREG